MHAQGWCQALLLAIVLALGSPSILSAAGFDESDAITRANQAFIVSAVMDGAENLRTVVQLYNPPGSGHVLYIDTITITYSSSPIGVDVRIHSGGQFGSLIGYGQNKNFEGVPGVAQLRGYNVPAYAIPGTIISEFWRPAAWNDGTYQFVPALRVPAGFAILLATASDWVWMPITIQYREY